MTQGARQTVWWVGDPGDPDDYESQYQESSPKFSSRELAETWKDREERQGYAARLTGRASLPVTYAQWLAEARAATPADARRIDALERSLASAVEQNALLETISLEDWLTSTAHIVVGGWRQRYRVDSEVIFETIDG